MFWHGCNYPWSTDGTSIYYGMDFGANVWGSHAGVSTRRLAIVRDFEQMAGLGFTVARWFVFADGRSGIEYDDPAALEKKYPYYDPIYTLPPSGREYWAKHSTRATA